MTYGYSGWVVLGRLWLPNMGPDRITHSGGGIVTLTGEVWADDADQATILREMLVRLPEDQDPVMPCSTLSTGLVEGFYRVQSVSAESTQALHSGYVVPYAVTLEPVPDFTSPAAEVTWSTVRRTNASGIAPANHYLRRAIPSPGGWRRVGGGSYAATSRATSTGTTICETTAAVNTARVESFPARPDTWYEGATSIEVLYPSSADPADDDNWWPLVGNRIPRIGADPMACIRMTNGLVRLTFNAGGNGRIRHELWTGSAWSAVDFATGDTLSYYTSALQSPSVVRNDRDAAVLRFVAGPAAMLLDGAATVTVSLLPGELWAGITVDPSRTSWLPLVIHASFTASTGVTGGLRSTGPTAGGTRSLIGTSASFSTNLTDGAVIGTSAGVMHFCVGQSLGGASATGRDTEVNIIQDWIAAHSARTIVVPK